LSPAAAETLAEATLHGAGVMAGADPDVAAMRRAVTSKGGTTEAALRSLDAAGFASIVAAAIDAAVARSRALSAEFGSRN
jgi:pyrroline-5-carboxylate reductase